MEKLKNSGLERFTGVHWWGDCLKSKEDKVIIANFIKEGEEVNVDYEYEGEQGWLKLYSNDGIHYKGKFGRIKEEGTCEFTLYKNIEEWLLFGWGHSFEEDDFGWYIVLKPSK